MISYLCSYEYEPHNMPDRLPRTPDELYDMNHEEENDEDDNVAPLPTEWFDDAPLEWWDKQHKQNSERDVDDDDDDDDIDIDNDSLGGRPSLAGAPAGDAHLTPYGSTPYHVYDHGFNT